MINKFETLYGESKALQEGYKFDPGELEELVTKRKSFEDFQKAIKLMNKSLQILKNKDVNAINPETVVEVKAPVKVAKPSRRRLRHSKMLKLPESILKLSQKGQSPRASMISNSSLSPSKFGQSPSPRLKSPKSKEGKRKSGRLSMSLKPTENGKKVNLLGIKSKTAAQSGQSSFRTPRIGKSVQYSPDQKSKNSPSKSVIRKSYFENITESIILEESDQPFNQPNQNQQNTNIVQKFDSMNLLTPNNPITTVGGDTAGHSTVSNSSKKLKN